MTEPTSPAVRIPVSWVLVGGFMSLLGVLAVTLIASSFVTTQKVIEGLARDIMENIAGYTIAESQAFLTTARDAADLTQRLADSEIVDSANQSAMERYFIEQLTLYPQFSGIYLGKPDGSFIYVNRADEMAEGAVRTKLISLAPPETPDGTPMRTVELIWRSRSLRELGRRFDPDDRYDPRTRPWYHEATSREALIWTDPYVFYTARTPGVTTASPVYRRTGELRGVVGVDMEIGQISRFLADRRIGRSGAAFIVHRNGDVIAHPRPDLVLQPQRGPDAPARLTKITEIDDPASRAAFAALDRPLAEMAVGDFVFTSFDHGGDRYHGMFTPFSDPQWPWIMGIYLPENDYLGIIIENQWQNMVISAVVALIALGLALVIARGLVRPVRALQRQASALGGGALDTPWRLKTIYRELQDTGDAFGQMQQALHHSQLRYRLAALGATDALFDFDCRAGTAWFAPRAAEILGHEGRFVGTRLTDWLAHVVDEDRPAVREAFARFLDTGGGILDIEYRVRTAAGASRWVQSRGTAVRDELGRALRAAGSISDITARKTAEAKLLHEVTHDRVTGLANSAHFETLLQAMIDAVPVGGVAGAAPALLVIDLDRFRSVNDCLGQGAGDELLAETARRITGALVDAARDGPALGGPPVTGRMAADVFAVALPAVVDGAVAFAVAERVAAALCAPLTLGGERLHLTAAIGVALTDPGDRRHERLVACARLAMKAAKARGRGGIELFRRGQRPIVPSDRLTLEADLRDAIDRGELALHYQPVVEIATGRIVGMEGLLRWAHPTRGTLSPAVIIPLAEDTDLIRPIGAWGVAEACRQLAAWRALRPQGPDDLWVSVNISRRQFLDGSLESTVDAALAAAGVPAPALKLEVTESLIMADLEHTRAVLRAIRRLGVKVAIDDFGTGYSSLSLLHTMPFDALKIDRSFVSNLRTDARVRLILDLLLRLAAGFGVETIAEGAETGDEIESLRATGCRLCQGFYYSRPVPAAAATALVTAAEPAFDPPAAPPVGGTIAPAGGLSPIRAANQPG